MKTWAGRASGCIPWGPAEASATNFVRIGRVDRSTGMRRGPGRRFRNARGGKSRAAASRRPGNPEETAGGLLHPNSFFSFREIQGVVHDGSSLYQDIVQVRLILEGFGVDLV